MTWPTEALTLQPGELLLLYSDGLTEARNAAEQEFGEERLEGTLRLFAGVPASTLVGELAAAVSRFCGRVAPEDDVSIAVLKLKA
jgi:sigma-B regulation protein RsbU (phosphoserine phosphatase)